MKNSSLRLYEMNEYNTFLCNFAKTNTYRVMNDIKAIEFLRLCRILTRYPKLININGRLPLLVLIVVYNKPNRFYEPTDFLRINKVIDRVRIRRAIIYLRSVGYLENTKYKTKFKLSLSGELIVKNFLQYYEDHQKQVFNQIVYFSR